MSYVELKTCVTRPTQSRCGGITITVGVLSVDYGMKNERDMTMGGHVPDCVMDTDGFGDDQMIL